jgi:predicted transposase/invertase (TIGR01784 family)
MVDCVFKAILGSRGNEPVLIDFLNAVLRLPTAITEVEIANPYNEKAFMADKRAIVDIKAFDRNGQCYQVEVQTSIPSYLHHRVLYMWADLYANPFIIVLWLMIQSIKYSFQRIKLFI